MSTAAFNWPSELPQDFLSGFQEEPVSNVIETPTDTGPMKRRRRGTAKPILYRGTMLLTGAQKAILDTFYRDTLGEVETFNLDNPITGTLEVFAFVNPPQSQHLEAGDGSLYQVSLVFERPPQVP